MNTRNDLNGQIKYFRDSIAPFLFEVVLMTQEESPLTPSTLRRQLSVTYLHNGKITSDDPGSYKGEECRAHERSLLRQHPHTGYSDGIRKKNKNPVFFQPYTRVSDFLETVLDPIITPIGLAFKSLSYLFNALVNSVEFIIDGGFALLGRPFSKKFSNAAFALAMLDFEEARTDLFKSVLFAVGSILSLVDNLFKLITRTGASLAAPFLSSDDEESTSCFSFK